jgi:hypothetical protein
MKKHDNTSANHSAAVFAIVDVTDPKQVWLKENVLPLFQFNKWPEAEAWFELSVITDKQINPVFSYHLLNALDGEQDNKNNDEQFRKRTILAFSKKVKNSIDTIYKLFDTTTSLPHSECFARISTELTKLNSLSSKRKMLLVFSDLRERAAFDAYKNISTMSAQQIASVLIQHHALPDTLTGIQVSIIYQPASRMEDQQIMKMVDAYKYLIERRGGSVTITANDALLINQNEDHE